MTHSKRGGKGEIRVFIIGKILIPIGHEEAAGGGWGIGPYLDDVSRVSLDFFYVHRIQGEFWSKAVKGCPYLVLVSQ